MILVRAQNKTKKRAGERGFIFLANTYIIMNRNTDKNLNIKANSSGILDRDEGHGIRK